MLLCCLERFGRLRYIDVAGRTVSTQGTLFGDGQPYVNGFETNSHPPSPQAFDVTFVVLVRFFLRRLRATTPAPWPSLPARPPPPLVPNLLYFA